MSSRQTKTVYFGNATLVEDDNERQKLFPLFQTRLGADSDILEEARQEDGHQFYKVSVTNWYAFGKFGQPSGGKHELAWNGGKL